MKILGHKLSFAIALSLFLAQAAQLRAAPQDSSELRDIPLASKENYDPRQEQGRGFNAFFSGIGVAVFGPNTDLSKVIVEKLDQDALRKYFPDPSEKNRISQKIGNEAKSRFLSQSYNNTNVLAALRYSTDELVGTIVKRVLEREGVKDSSRASQWSTKMLAPFNHCMSLARSLSEGKKCAAPLETDLIKNIGLAMTYEITRQEFGVASTKGRPADYVRCVNSGEHEAPPEKIISCATTGVRKAASAYGRARVLAVAQKTMPAASSNKVIAKVMPDFDKCLNTSKERVGFVKCGDKLIAKAGAEIASEAIRLDARVGSYFPEKGDRERISGAGREAFSKCMTENERQNRRDASGTLLTANCENFVRMETARTVALEVMRRTIAENTPSVSPAELQKMQFKVKDQLTKCWDSSKSDSKNGDCLRNVAKQAALEIAAERLGRELPTDLQKQEPKLKEQVLASFGTCMEQHLPKNLLESSSADLGIEACATGVFRETALRVAEAKVKKALEGKPAAITEKIVENLVKKDFAACLGAKPNQATLAACSIKLQRGVAAQAAQELLPERVDAFFKQGGGLEAYGYEEEKKNALLSEVIAGHKQCLQSEVKGTTADVNEVELNSCLKSTIRELTLRLAPLELARTSKASGVEVTAALKEEFKNDFGACLDKKKGAEFSVDDYAAGLDACQAEITKTYTIKIAKAELSNAIKQLFSDAASSAPGAELEAKLFAAFDKCMETAADGTAREACITKLKSGATVELARAGVRTKTLKALGVLELPPELVAQEKNLNKCLEEKKISGDDCAIAHVKASTIAIAKLVLRSKLKEAFNEAKLRKFEPEIQKLEEPFRACVNETPAPLNNAFLDKIDECGNKLTESALAFAMTQLSTVPAAPSSSTAPAVRPPAPSPDGVLTEAQLADMVTRAVLCLNGALTTDNEQALTNIQPGGIESQLLDLVASYVKYDLNAAHGQIAPVLAQLAEDLKAAGPAPARKNLIDQLVKQGMVDQLLKAMARSEIEKVMNELPPGRKLPPDLEKKLLDKHIMDKALNPDVMSKLRPILADGVLKPILVDGKTGLNVFVIYSYRNARTQAIDAMIASPEVASDDATRQKIKNALK